MRENGPLVLLVSALTILGVRGLSSVPSAPTEKPGEVKGRIAEQDPLLVQADSGRPFWRPLEDFRNTGWKNKEGDDKETKVWGGFPDVTGWELKTLIVCVPDPVGSSAGHRFDPLVDAVQRAAETAGYVLDRFYYPWSGQRSATAKNGSGGASDVTIRGPVVGTSKGEGPPLLRVRVSKESMPGGARYEREPGVLLFRAAPKGKEKGRLLLVFLVGETATAGTHKEAFSASLRLIERTQDYKENRQVRILGPHFSGSIISLQQVKKARADQKKLPPDFRIISGSATAVDFNRVKEDFPNFKTTVVPETKVIQEMLKYLANRAGERPTVALVCEGNTRFGSELSKVSQKTPGLTVLPYPLHISDLRGAYQRASGGANATGLRLPSFGSKLRAPLEERWRDRETGPSLDPAMTAVTTERVLASILHTISLERYRYVLIVGTSIKDRLFLATLIRQQCPEVRLLFSNSDVLLGHPDFSSDLRGSIVGSTYPLHPKNQHWSFPFQGRKRRLLFPGQSEQGYYNAMVALLGQEAPKDAYLEYGPPFPKLWPECKRGRKPPIWISIIGQAGPEPLTVVPYTSCTEPDIVFTAPEEGEDPEEKAKLVPANTALWVAPAIALTLFAFFVGMSSILALRKPATQTSATQNDEKPDEEWGMVKLFSQRSADRRRAQRLYSAVCLGPVFVALAYFAFVWMIPLAYRCYHGEDSPVDGRLPNAPLAVLMLLAFVTLFFSLGRQLWALLKRAPQFCIAIRARWQVAWKSKKLLLRLPALLERRGRELGISTWALLQRTSQWGTLGRIVGWLSGPFVVRHRVFVMSLFLLSIMVVYLVRNGRMPKGWQWSSEGLFFYERATNLASGVSPVLPVVFLALAFFWWGQVQLKRLYLLDETGERCLFPEQFKDLQRCQRAVERLLRSPGQVVGSWQALLVWLALFFTFCRLARRFVPSVDGVIYDTLILLALTVFTLLIAYGLLHLLSTWEALRKLLQEIAALSLGDAFRRLPGTITAVFGPYLTLEASGRQAPLALQKEQIRLLAEKYKEVSDQLSLASLGAKAALDQALNRDDHPHWQVAAACLPVLQEAWSRLPLAERLGKSPVRAEVPPSAAPPKEATAAPKEGGLVVDVTVHTAAPSGSDEKQQWLRLAEDVVALEVVVCLNRFFVHFRNLAWFLLAAPLLLLLAVTSYPFQPQRLWLTLILVLAACVMGTLLRIYVQMERNEAISNIVGSSPNRVTLNWNFLSSVFVSAIPVLGVIAATSSDLSDLIHSSIDPLLQVLR